MTIVDKNILNTYSQLFEGLDAVSKKELISGLQKKSLDKPDSLKEEAFYKTFGAFPDDKPAEELMKEVRASRTFHSI